MGRLAQLVRALRLHRRCREFESLIAHLTTNSIVLLTHEMSDYNMITFLGASNETKTKL